ncbi:MAG: primosomal protein N' [Candidatus Sericytochromatia bacterium]
MLETPRTASDLLTLRELVPGYSPDDPAAGAPYAEVMIDAITLVDPRPYTYAVPAAWRGKLLPGQAVLVPFGPKRGVAGYVTALSLEPPGDHALREIEEVVAGDVVPPQLQALLMWLAEATLTPLSQVMATAMPKGTLARLKRTVHLAVSLEGFVEASAHFTGPASVLAKLLIENEGACSLSRLQTAAKKSSAVLADWRRRGYIRHHTTLATADKREKTQIHASLTSGAFEPLTERQAEIVGHLSRHGGCLLASELAKATGTSLSTLRNIEKRGAIRLHPQSVRRSAVGVATGAKPPELTAHQQEVLEAIRARVGTPSTFLLHGVTGSGKTEIYLRAIAEALDRGQGAIVLVPEISLTPQTVRRFQGRFGDTVAVLHSHLGTGERYDEWQRIREGEARVVIGARSAIFAPMDDLGLVIIDEEHEGSYKQDSAPRYHARTVAEKRCELEGATLILGSATPCLESYAEAEAGRYHLLEMPDRVYGQVMPPVTVVDMREELKCGNRKPFSRKLASALAATVARGEQAILLMNRRGYSSFVFCRECGFVCRCERCAVAMTFHQNAQGGLLRCHYCDAGSRVPETCPSCKSPYIRHFGAGTQQIEEVCKQMVPDARIMRVDRDTTSRKGSHQTLLDAFGRGEYDVLIGTQMVAKGLDFPRVTLVGVMAADGALHLPDFRASEHTFQLLTQVAGRAGRSDLESEVVIQTYSPEHPAIQAAKDHDFHRFYAYEAGERASALYPPFIHLASVLVAGPELKQVRRVTTEMAERLKAWEALTVYGPLEAPLAMLRGLHRQMVIIKVEDLDLARQALRQAVAPCQEPGVRIGIDLDPYSML